MSYNLLDKLRARENNISYQDISVFQRRLFRERLNVARNLYQTDLKGHYSCVNDVKFSENGNLMVSVSYDKRLLVWDVEKCLAGSINPWIMIKNHRTSVLCLALDKSNDFVTTSTRSGALYIYDLHTNQLMYQTSNRCRILSISINPKTSKQFAVASKDGCIFIYDIRCQPESSLMLESNSAAFQSVEYHPLNSDLFLTGHICEGTALYDIRRPYQCLRKYKALKSKPNTCSSAKFNRMGNMILTSGRKLPLILYGVDSPEIVCTFYDDHYLASCTKKSGIFFGEDDEFIATGSDDFNVHIWRISDINLNITNQHVNQSHMVLHGHRSIVNSVQYNRQKCLFASYGVEKIIKLWSPFNHKNWIGNLTEVSLRSRNFRSPNPHRFTFEYIPHLLTHIWQQNTDEDPFMLALFDFMLYKEYVLGQPSNSLMHFV